MICHLPLTDMDLGTYLRTPLLLRHLVRLMEWGGGVLEIFVVIFFAFTQKDADQTERGRLTIHTSTSPRKVCR